MEAELKKINVLASSIPEIIEQTKNYPNTTEFAKNLENETKSLSKYSERIKELKNEAINLNIKNIICKKIDFLENGTSLDDNSQGHVMIYNLLHLENPQKLLKEAFRILKDDGIISIIH